MNKSKIWKYRVIEQVIQLCLIIESDKFLLIIFCFFYSGCWKMGEREVCCEYTICIPVMKRFGHNNIRLALSRILKTLCSSPRAEVSANFGWTCMRPSDQSEPSIWCTNNRLGTTRTEPPPWIILPPRNRANEV